MTKQILAIVLMLIPALSFGSDTGLDSRFAKYRGSAETIAGLGAFLDRYVGDCGGPENAECRQKSAAYRQSASGKRFYALVGDDAGSLISFGGGTDDSVTLNVVPFFGAGGSAVTQGAPTRTDASGNPILPTIAVKGSTPKGGDIDSLSRLISTRGLRMQVVFTPLGLWQLAKKGGGKISGVKARIEAILITVARTGEPIGLWSAK